MEKKLKKWVEKIFLNEHKKMPQNGSISINKKKKGNFVIIFFNRHVSRMAHSRVPLLTLRHGPSFPLQLTLTTRLMRLRSQLLFLTGNHQITGSSFFTDDRFTTQWAIIDEKQLMFVEI